MTAQGNAAVVPVFELDGHWYTWKGHFVDGGTAYRTTTATATTLISGREVFVFTGGKGVPSSELEALTAKLWLARRFRAAKRSMKQRRTHRASEASRNLDPIYF
jgi:hypothetical protein